MRLTCFLVPVATFVVISIDFSSADDAALANILVSEPDPKRLDSGKKNGHIKRSHNQIKEGNEERIAAVLAAHVAARNGRFRRQASEAIEKVVERDPLTRNEFIAALVASGVGAAALGGIFSAGGGSGNNVGDFGGVTYIPAENLRDQLLNNTDINPDTLVAVASSYRALNDDSIGIRGATAPNTTVFASILVMPSFTNDTVSTSGNQSEPTLNNKLSDRTQLLYNCTSAANLWNLLEDSNVVKLEDFQQFPSSDSNTVDSSSGSNANTSAPRDTIAVAVNSSLLYLFITGSVVLSNSSGSNSSSSADCRLKLEMAQAILSDVYPQCKIRFGSTDLDTILLESPALNDDSERPSRRLEDASSFDFIRDPSCTTECGVDDLDHNNCYAPASDGQQTVVQCKMQFYAKNSACNFECGDETGSPHNQSALDVSQCYSCYSESKHSNVVAKNIHSKFTTKPKYHHESLDVAVYQWRLFRSNKSIERLLSYHM
ncbi:hypothetical protein F441_22905 [Phytophthora nicotianae CJ01A1]|uniref:Uncharacterized protein n=2 Tax=Phytophthora nicotianae TaxID=4792 RepID=W2VN39_PHYNI|nr:hypothetical protein F441_22905 [Phytophthora nicotianae CJ01A1]